MSEAVREKANSPSIGQTAARVMMLEKAVSHLKQKPLAEAMGITHRNLQQKLAVERSVFDGDLQLAAAALDQRATEIAGLAASMRAAAGQ